MEINKPKFTYSVFMLSVVSVFSGPVLGDDDMEGLLEIYGSEDLISIATGIEQPIHRAPSVASVITEEDIERIGATDIDEVLETVPGLHVSRSTIGYNPIYTFRGMHTNTNPQVLVSINSIPITNSLSGDRGQIWGGMPVEMISRIEVIRGPGSAIYGADAFAGVINIITKSYDDIEHGETGVRVGSHDTQDFWVLNKHQVNDFKIAWGFEYHNTDGQNEIIDQDAQSELDSVFGTSASLAPGPVSLSRENIDARLDIEKGLWRLRSGLQYRSDWGNGAGVADALDPHNRYRSKRTNIDLTFEDVDWLEETQLNFEISYFDTTQEIEEDLIIFPPGTNLGTGVFETGLIGNPEVFERHFRTQSSLIFRQIKSHTISTGIGYKYDDIYETRDNRNFDPITFAPLTSDGSLVSLTDQDNVFLPEVDRENFFIYTQDIWHIAKDWELTSGIRYDKYSDFGETINPRLALVWFTDHNLSSKLLYGEAFRAPAFAETSVDSNPARLGNPNLDPEKIKTVELAFDYYPKDNLQMALNLFHYEWDDIIDFVTDSDQGITRAQNTGRQTGKGFEIEIDWRAHQALRYIANVAFQNSEDKSTGSDAANAPQKQFYFRAEWDFLPEWQANLQTNWVFDRARSEDDTRGQVDDYVATDLNFRYIPMNSHFETGFIIKNLFNEDIREPGSTSIPNDLPQDGRSIMGELAYKF